MTDPTDSPRLTDEDKAELVTLADRLDEAADAMMDELKRAGERLRDYDQTDEVDDLTGAVGDARSSVEVLRRFAAKIMAMHREPDSLRWYAAKIMAMHKERDDAE